MKKVMTIRLGHYVLTVDEDAAELIAEYTRKLHQKYAAEESGQEIIEDIEERMGELLKQRQEQTIQNYTTAKDANAVIEQLGSLEDESTDRQTFTANNTDQKKRLFRDTENGLIGGVCAGLAAYFSIDVVVVRILMIIASIFLGFGFPIYIILWAISPEARSTADRLMMQGRNPTLQNIEETVKNEFRKVEERLNKNGGSGDIFRTIFRNIIAIIVFAFRLVGWIITTALIIALIALLVALTADFTTIEIANLRVYGTDGVNQLMALPWGNSWATKFIFVSFLLSAIISIVLNMGGIRRRVRPEFKIAGRWLIALNILLFAAGVVTVIKGFSSLANPSVYYSGKEKLTVMGDTLYLRSSEAVNQREGMWTLNEMTEFRVSDDSFFHIETRYKYFKGLRRNLRNNNTFSGLWNMQKDSLTLKESQAFQYASGNAPGYYSYIIYIPAGKHFRMSPDFGFENTNNSQVYPSGKALMMSGDGIIAGQNRSKNDTLSDDISRLEVDGLFDIQVYQGGTHNKIELISGPVLNHPDWISENGNEISISAREPRDHFNTRRSVIRIYMKELNTINAGATSRVKLHNIKTDMLRIDAESAARVQGSVNAGSLELNLSAASEVQLSGVCNELTAEVESASTLNALNLSCNTVNADISGASLAEIWATRKINGSVNAASKLILKGNPQESRLENNGASNIEKI